MSREYEQIQAAKWLAENGTKKHIIECLIPLSDKYLKDIYKTAPKSKHRYGNHWLRCESAYMADRAYRLFILLFGSEAVNKPINIIELTLFCQTYFTKFPSDEMSTDRLHYLILSIRNGDAIIKEKCNCCGQPFVLHRDESFERTCHICKILSEKQ